LFPSVWGEPLSWHNFVWAHLQFLGFSSRLPRGPGRSFRNASPQNFEDSCY
jgi:hypothetical protein